MTLPRPNWPEALFPHDHKVPSVLMETVCVLPHDTDNQLVNAPTCLGEL